MAKLILRGEDGAEQEFSLDKSGSLTIGRSPECEIPISDSQASRRHCSVVRLQKGYELADLGSTNGTLLNSTLVKRKKLKHGDVIRIGGTEIAFSDPEAVGTGGGEMENCSLVFARGDRKGNKLELLEQRTTIGRKETNTIPLKDANASSYHCEIVRDLNGYTIRDLGSTNGTLVNNEMITEAQLAHGARIRIGSTRFVFQDPALAEIDLELAGVDDDETDWGMMRELDLAAVRKRHPMTYVYLVVFLLIVAAGYFAATMEGPKEKGGVKKVASNLVEDYSFESPASAFAWESDSPGAVISSVTGKVKGQGKSALELKVSTDVVDVFYSERPPGDDVRHKLSGKLSVMGGARARVGILWSGHRLTRWTLTPPITAGTLTEFSLICDSPVWSNRARLGVSIEGPGTVYLDDVVLIRQGKSQPLVLEQNQFRFTGVDEQDVDITHVMEPILANGRLFLRDASGNELDPKDLKISGEVTDKEHLLGTIEGAGDAAEVGLELEEVRGYLSQGGFRAFAPDQEPSFYAAFPDSGTLKLGGVRKLLLGSKGKALAFLPPSDDARLQSEARVEGEKRFWSIYGKPEGGKFSFRIKTDLTGETRDATRAFTHARTLYNAGRMGEFLEAAQGALAEFPFASQAMQRQLRARVEEVTREYGGMMREADAMIQDYKEFKDLQSLDRVQEILKVWRDKFQVAPGQGTRGKVYEKYASTEASHRMEAERKRQSSLSRPFLEQAQYIHLAEGENYSAAVLLSYISNYLPASDEAKLARDELAKIEKEHPDVLKVLKALELRGD
ncbi:MAG: FHA domain-containing protein [Planctomycetota bacterium]|jgi:pSer/pThr/pTyr-binding forkhead associated (FHA) protein